MDRVENELMEAMARRCVYLAVETASCRSVLVEHFRLGMNDVYMDRCYLNHENR